MHGFSMKKLHGYGRRFDTRVLAVQWAEKEQKAIAAVKPLGGLAVTVLAAMEGADTWVDTIRGASKRIETLTSSRQRLPRAVAEPMWDFKLARELLREDRFAEALDLLHRIPPKSGRDPDVLLLRAALFTHGGLAEAEEECRYLFGVDELSACAHYLLSLCRDGARKRTSAVNHRSTH
jgi:chemotaxis protein methyltransferase CheR